MLNTRALGCGDKAAAGSWSDAARCIQQVLRFCTCRAVFHCMLCVAQRPWWIFFFFKPGKSWLLPYLRNQIILITTCNRGKIVDYSTQQTRTFVHNRTGALTDFPLCSWKQFSFQAAILLLVFTLATQLAIFVQGRTDISFPNQLWKVTTTTEASQPLCLISLPQL